MTTRETTTQAPAQTETPKATAPKTLSIRLTGGQEEMLLSGWQTRDGWKTAAVRYREPAAKGKKRTGERGATQTHATMDAAKAALEKLAGALIRGGWVRPERKALGGFVAREDAFGLNNLPRPGSPKPSAKK